MKANERAVFERLLDVVVLLDGAVFTRADIALMDEARKLLAAPESDALADQTTSGGLVAEAVRAWDELVYDLDCSDAEDSMTDRQSTRFTRVGELMDVLRVKATAPESDALKDRLWAFVKSHRCVEIVHSHHGFTFERGWTIRMFEPDPITLANGEDTLADAVAKLPEVGK